MQVSYSVTGENGQDAVAQLEARIRHDAQEVRSLATVKVLDGIARYVRDAVEQTREPVEVDVALTIRARKTGTTPVHLAPRSGLVATVPDSGLEAVPRGDEGDEVGITERAGEVIRSLSLVSDEELERIETEALVAAQAAAAESGQ